jgi:hypothetical protein
VLAAATCLFLAIYITADGSGARPFWFNAARFAASAVCDSILAIFIVKILRPEE